MSKTIKDRVLTLGASIAKGLTRLDQARTTTVVRTPSSLLRSDIEKLVKEANERAVQQARHEAANERTRQEVSLAVPRPTAADLTQVWIAIDELRESDSELHSAHDRMDALLGKIDAALKALVTEEPK